MKKTLTLIALSAVLLTALTGCSGSAENNSASENESSIEQSADNSSETEEVSENVADESSHELSVEVSENSTVSDVSNEDSANSSPMTAEQSTLTVYVLEVSEGCMKGESIPAEEGSSEVVKTVTIYNDNINTEDITEGMVVTITYTGELSPNGEEYTVNADAFETL